MITLYELHWSHYCEKIRWALNYKKLNWKKININAFTKQELKGFPCNQKRYLVPHIYDEHTKTSVSESSQILQYLEETYSESPVLFPKRLAEKEAVCKLLIEFDSKLGVIARRLGYTQLILEKPTILSELFLSNIFNGFFNWPGVRRISSAVLGMMLIKRFRFDLNESLYLYEELADYLLTILEKLKINKFLIGNTFSAADLTLAVYLRPLLIIPFFYEHPGLANLFEWRRKIMAEYKGEDKFLYEELLEKQRETQPPVRRKIREYQNQPGFLKKIESEIKNNPVAFNDHNKIWTWSILRVPYYYFVKIRVNKLRQQLASVNVR